jgi:uncharacterized protein YecE (DUF72 family)
MTGNVHVGVSGFSYPSWKGEFYPRDTKSEEFLAYYSQRLDSVEINSSFYAVPKTSILNNWSEKTSGGFVFSFKAPRQITHILKLGEGSFEVVDRFSKALESLGPRRGPVLFQLPPFLKKNDGLLEEFLSGTSAVKSRVFEFRHKSWFEDSTYQLLERMGAGFCIAETEDLRPEFQVTGGLAYFRLRMERYDAAAIDDWAKKIRGTVKGLQVGYAYLRHDESGRNAVLAQRLSEKLKAAKD